MCALALAAIAVGCGSSGNSTSTATALTKDEFVKQANAICHNSNQQINAEGDQLFGQEHQTQAELNHYTLSSVVPGIEKQISELRALIPPAGDEATVNAMLDAVEQGNEELKAHPEQLTQGDDAGGAFAEANKLTNDYGLTVCAGGG
jgi:hypothetical protein